ncbi:hypothetical protein RFI_00585 [Reticulomyxa filosa]|uniref:Uncharacterized protein n=1 Tax=Reticulomyxa filosa TaxID=46433 RepID=X6PFM4_RETFI|nr:hypothetical protein RFI_00585 [Reticulomyxa filosa]|eukprot:ETO36477.1 hypothetical protein RFI_00585 [Reticulomyxa filosa]
MQEMLQVESFRKRLWKKAEHCRHRKNPKFQKYELCKGQHPSDSIKCPVYSKNKECNWKKWNVYSYTQNKNKMNDQMEKELKEAKKITDFINMCESVMDFIINNNLQIMNSSPFEHTYELNHLLILLCAMNWICIQIIFQLHSISKHIDHLQKSRNKKLKRGI